jgi:hypothetical protein
MLHTVAVPLSPAMNPVTLSTGAQISLHVLNNTACTIQLQWVTGSSAGWNALETFILEVDEGLGNALAFPIQFGFSPLMPDCPTAAQTPPPCSFVANNGQGTSGSGDAMWNCAR